MLGYRPVVVVLALVGAGCLRGPIYGDESFGATDGNASSGDTADDTQGLSMSGSVLTVADTGADASDEADDGTPPSMACHPSYVPCLPVTDDLNCSDVRALDAAPVQVVGPDEYGLDADGDGIGCET